jgi:hypothetical protein
MGNVFWTLTANPFACAIAAGAKKASAANASRN